MYKYSLILLIFLFGSVYGQDQIWDQINSANSGLPNESVKCIALDTTGAMWVGTYMGGIARFQNDEWTVYNTSNSELPHNYINAISIDKNNLIWIGTDGGGLVKFDGTNWEIFKTSNSGLPSNVVMDVHCSENGVVWVGTYFGGLAKLENGKWTVFNEENSELISEKVVVVTEDQNNIIWVGTQGGGAASFDGNEFVVYTERNSNLPNDYVYSISVDKDNSKWIGTGGGGIGVFNDIFWIVFNTSNSGISDDNIRPIHSSPTGHQWVGTYMGGLSIFDGEEWKNYDYRNSNIPDDEITYLARDENNKVFIATERTGIVTYNDSIRSEATGITEEITSVKATSIMFGSTAAVHSAEPKSELPIPETDSSDPEVQDEELEIEPTEVVVTSHSIVLVYDAADVYQDKARSKENLRSFKILLNDRERINETYKVTVLVFSSNEDVDPETIIIDDKDINAMGIKDVVRIEGETSFSQAITRAYNIIKEEDYNPEGNNHVIASTYKYIRDDEKAKVIIKDNLDKNYIIFSLIAYGADTWTMEYKMRDMVPKGHGHYYPIEKIEILDNWSATFQLGTSIFRGDMDVDRVINFPGEFGFAINKKILSNGIIAGGIKGQFNFGELNGKKNNHSFENKYKEGALNFQVILNRWFKSNFKFETLRPYAFAGIGFINYRVVLRNGDGNVVNGYGYKVIEGDKVANGPDPEKDKAVTELIFPLGLGANYKINEKFNLELEASSRFINSDKLDGKVSWKNDKYWFVSLGITYKFKGKDFLHDVLNK
jgi:hypothetical protein